MDLLSADRVHLLADQLHDFIEGPLRQEQIRKKSAAGWPDVARAQEQLMAHCARFRWILTQGWDEEPAPAHEIFSLAQGFQLFDSGRIEVATGVGSSRALAAI